VLTSELHFTAPRSQAYTELFKVYNFILFETSVCFAFNRFETCWPAMAKDASGVVFVSDSDQTNIQDLESWFVLS